MELTLQSLSIKVFEFQFEFSLFLCGNSHVERFTHSFMSVCLYIMPVF